MDNTTIDGERRVGGGGGGKKVGGKGDEKDYSIQNGGQCIGEGFHAHSSFSCAHFFS